MIFYGEQTCTAMKASGLPCTNRAYYVGQLCGTHSNKSTRQKLCKNPNVAMLKEQSIVDHSQTLEVHRTPNERGKVVMTKMRMMQAVGLIPGFMNVFPNNKHANRQDGWGCPSLSPMRLGPVIHNEPDYPPCMNIENYHQQSKVFPTEVDANGDPTLEFYKRRKDMFICKDAFRHKYPDLKMYPLYSVFFDQDGTEHRYSYIESRQFYCRAYEHLAKQTEDYKRLIELRDKGFHLRIVGYDGFDLRSDRDDLVDLLKTHYLDDSKPFGHEVVLFTMLTIEEKDYPWPNK